MRNTCLFLYAKPLYPWAYYAPSRRSFVQILYCEENGKRRRDQNRKVRCIESSLCLARFMNCPFSTSRQKSRCRWTECIKRQLTTQSMHLYSLISPRRFKFHHWGTLWTTRGPTTAAAIWCISSLPSSPKHAAECGKEPRGRQWVNLFIRAVSRRITPRTLSRSLTRRRSLRPSAEEIDSNGAPVTWK